MLPVKTAVQVTANLTNWLLKLVVIVQCKSILPGAMLNKE
jgi:hypothetical protein